MQKWVVHSLAGIITVGISHLLTDQFFEEMPPEQRNLEEDIKEAALHAAASLAATILASVIVRRLVRG